MSGLRTVKGTHDLLPEALVRWRWVECVVRDHFERHGYGEVRTPVFEALELFVRGIGEATDIVEKEMYVFGRGTTQVALRPEGTAPVVRAYLQSGMARQQPLQTLYYIGPMFRYERPQAARQRQFHQFGVEALGSPSPLLDAETIVLAADLFAALGLPEVALLINSVGCAGCRPAYREALREALRPQAGAMCPDCQGRLERNVLRVLDCKRPACQGLLDAAPPVAEYLCEPCQTHDASVRAALDEAGVAYAVTPRLVRGLDYYTRTVYEFCVPAIGARSTICGGGRYDGLVAELGGPSLGAVGFACGIEALLLALDAVGTRTPPAPPGPDLWIIAIGDEARGPAFALATAVRRAGHRCVIDHGDRSVKKQMRAANRDAARFCLFAGPDELASGRYRLKRMADGEESDALTLDEVLARL